MNIPYRPDIDGLRAIAVISVILFHINAEWLSGGFLGVDVFFVISGYLITLLLVKDIASRGRLDLAGFYERRVRRIMPALLLVMVMTTLAAFLMLTPERLHAHLSATLWSLFSLANIHFYRSLDTSYFADDSREVPLLHLWSLGVEEQFYLIWPLLLFLMLRYLRSAAAREGLLLVLCLLSLLLAQYQFSHHHAFAYYLLPTRAWELGMGSLAALMVQRGIRLGRSLAGWAASLGLAMVLVAVSVINETDAVPGIAALPAVLGSFLLVIAGANGIQGVSALLALPWVVRIGLISYSAYLWHWPLLAFARYANGEVGTVAGIVIFLLTMLCAAATYRLVETPTRRSRAPRVRVFRNYLVLPVILMGCACFFLQQAIVQKQAWVTDWASLDQMRTKLATILRSADQYDYSCHSGKEFNQAQADSAACVFPVGAEPRVLLVGDSNAQHFIGMLRTFASDSGFAFRNLTQSACPFILTTDELPWVDREYAAGCQAYRTFLAGQVSHYDAIVIGGSWTTYDKKVSRDAFRRAFADTVAMLAKTGQQIIIIGKIPRFSDYNNECEIRALKLPWIDCARRYTREQPDHDINIFLQGLADRYDNVHYVSVRSALCQKGVCSPYLDSVPVYYDGGHLSMEGSTRLGQWMLQHNDQAVALFRGLGGHDHTQPVPH